MKNFKQLKVWQAGKQVTRAALSIPSNVAEGSSRESEKDYHRFLQIALGSAFELETQLEVIAELEVVSAEDAQSIISLTGKVQRRLYGLMKKLKT